MNDITLFVHNRFHKNQQEGNRQKVYLSISLLTIVVKPVEDIKLYFIICGLVIINPVISRSVYTLLKRIKGAPKC